VRNKHLIKILSDYHKLHQHMK